MILKEGPGIPLVFLHGFLGSPHDWEPVCSFLPSCHCIGLASPPTSLSRFHLIGYSMGGRIAASYATQHPEQIASLTLLSAHPGLTTDEEREKRGKTDEAWAKLLETVPIDEFLLQWYDQPIFKPFVPDLSMRKKQNPFELASILRRHSLAKQPYLAMKNVLVGERDLKFRSLHQDGIIVPNAGHMVHLENPQFVASRIPL